MKRNYDNMYWYFIGKISLCDVTDMYDTNTFLLVDLDENNCRVVASLVSWESFYIPPIAQQSYTNIFVEGKY